VVEGAGTRKAEGGEVIRLVVLGGTGDAYLICALAGAFERKHGRPVTVVMREKFGAVAELFPGVRVAFDEALVHRAENDPEMQRTYQNDLLSDDAPFYAHPCFVRSPTRVDHLTTKPDASQADMYRMVLGLPIETPLARAHAPAIEQLLRHGPADHRRGLMAEHPTPVLDGPGGRAARRRPPRLRE
jgi:hypothetical protein